MKRRNAQPLGDVLKDFFQGNEILYKRILAVRVEKAWGELLGPMIMQYTRSVYVKDRVLYVSLTSSVVRSELAFAREKLVKSLNEHAQADVIDSIVFR